MTYDISIPLTILGYIGAILGVVTIIGLWVAWADDGVDMDGYTRLNGKKVFGTLSLTLLLVIICTGFYNA